MKLKAVPQPGPFEKMVFIGDRAPLARDHGSEQFHCADCNELLLVQMSPRDMGGAAFRCPTCGAYNELDDEAEAGT